MTIKQMCEELTKMVGVEILLVSTNEYFGNWGLVDTRLEGPSSKRDIIKAYEWAKKGNILEFEDGTVVIHDGNAKKYEGKNSDLQPFLVDSWDEYAFVTTGRKYLNRKGQMTHEVMRSEGSWTWATDDELSPIIKR